MTHEDLRDEIRAYQRARLMTSRGILAALIASILLQLGAGYTVKSQIQFQIEKLQRAQVAQGRLNAMVEPYIERMIKEGK